MENESSSNSWSSWKKHYSLLLLCALNAVVSYADRTNISIAIVPMAKEYNWDKSITGLILSAFYYGYLCTQLIGGWLAYRVGGKKVLTVSCLFWSIFTILTPPAAQFSSNEQTRLVMLFMCRAALGLAEGMGYPAIIALISEYVPLAEHSKAVGFVLSGSYVGAVLSNLISGKLIEWSGWPAVFYLFGTLGIVWLVPWILYTPVPVYDILSDKDSDCNMKVVAEEDDREIAISDEEQITHIKSQVINWGLLLRSKNVWAIIVAQFCQSWSYWMFLNWLPMYYNDVFAIETEDNALFTTIPYVFQTITGLLAGPLSDWLLHTRGLSLLTVRRLMQCTGMLLMALFTCLAAMAVTNVYQGLVCVTLAMGVFNMTLAGVSVNPLDIAPRHASVVYGIGNTAAQLPGLFGVWFTGVLLQATHNNWSMAFGLAAVISAVGAVAWLFMVGVRPIIV